jgi:hypothetical protein
MIHFTKHDAKDITFKYPILRSSLQLDLYSPGHRKFFFIKTQAGSAIAVESHFFDEH